MEGAALGALWGAAVGNATGAMLQIGKRVSMQDVDGALAWESNRGSRRAPGQMKQRRPCNYFIQSPFCSNLTMSIMSDGC